MEVTIAPTRRKTPPTRLRTKGTTALVSALIAACLTICLITTAVNKTAAPPDRLADRFAPTSSVGRRELDNKHGSNLFYPILAGLAPQHVARDWMKSSRDGFFYMPKVRGS